MKFGDFSVAPPNVHLKEVKAERISAITRVEVQGLPINARLCCVSPGNLVHFISGDVVPPDTTLVFEIHLLDVWNKADLVVTKTIATPKDCKRSVMRTDFVRYHFNGTLLDGTAFDSR